MANLKDGIKQLVEESKEELNAKPLTQRVAQPKKDAPRTDFTPPKFGNKKKPAPAKKAQSIEENEFGIPNELWESATSGKADYINKHFRNGGKPNQRYHRFNRDNSLIMGALRNGKYDIADLLKSYGENIEPHEQEEYDSIMSKKLPSYTNHPKYNKDFDIERFGKFFNDDGTIKDIDGWEKEVAKGNLKPRTDNWLQEGATNDMALVGGTRNLDGTPKGKYALASPKLGLSDDEAESKQYDSLENFLEYNGFIGYDPEDIRLQASMGRDNLDQWLEDQGIFGYGEKLYQLATDKTDRNERDVDYDEDYERSWGPRDEDEIARQDLNEETDSFANQIDERTDELVREKQTPLPGYTPFEPTKKYGWDDFDQYEGQIHQYMQPQGEGDTLASQAVTAVNKLIYKWFNDGDTYDNTNPNLRGWANDLSSYANWLAKNVPGADKILEQYHDAESDDEYVGILYELAYHVLQPQTLQQLAQVGKSGSIYDNDRFGQFRFMNDQELGQDKYADFIYELERGRAFDNIEMEDFLRERMYNIPYPTYQELSKLYREFIGEQITSSAFGAPGNEREKEEAFEWFDRFYQDEAADLWNRFNEYAGTDY